MTERKRLGRSAIIGTVLAVAACSQEVRDDRADSEFAKLEGDGSLSRQELAERMQATSTIKVVKKHFKFPIDANDAEYGIDLSHHNGVVPWQSLSESGIRFVYLKAGEGISLADPQFQGNWQSIGKLAASGIKRGAYHFLFPLTDPTRQASAFVNRVKAAGGFLPSDLPPGVDVEWSCSPSAPKCDSTTDRWKDVPKVDRVAKVKAILREVEKLTGRKPVIYTNAGWWNSMIGADPAWAGYEFWLADYLGDQAPSTTPPSIAGVRTVWWQFSQTAQVIGNDGKPLKKPNGALWLIDANKVLGSGM